MYPAVYYSSCYYPVCFPGCFFITLLFDIIASLKTDKASQAGNKASISSIMWQVLRDFVTIILVR